MKKVCLLLIAAFIFILPNDAFAQLPQERIEAQIVELNDQDIIVKLLESDKKGEQYHVLLFDKKQIKSQQIQKGDTVLISFVPTQSGEQRVIIVDHVRRFPLFILFLIFVSLVISVGRLKGILSILGMFFSFLIIAQFIVQQIVIGNDPLLITMLGALFIIPITFYVGHGFKWQTHIAVVSTFIALIITGILAYIFVFAAKLTGFAAEEAVFIQSLPGKSINIQSLLLSGIIIGAMGILDDITISQTSIVDKLVKANPKYSFWDVYKEAMDVGRDHIASLVNTLILVYAGASLPLFVLFYNSQLGGYADVINMEIVATEIVRTLVGSIGIVAAVPITTFIASWYIRGKTH